MNLPVESPKELSKTRIEVPIFVLPESLSGFLEGSVFLTDRLRAHEPGSAGVSPAN